MSQTAANPARAAPAARTLVVVVHGLGSSAHRLRDVIAAARIAYGPDTQIFAPDLPHGSWLSGARAGAIIGLLLDGIDEQVRLREPDRIVLVGHSVGATLARRLFLVAAGWPSNFRQERDLGHQRPRDWAYKVERIVMLAAFNRGWKISERMSWYYSILFNLVGLFGHVPAPDRGWTPTAFDFRLGAPFMAQTRLHWLAYRRNPPRHLVDKDRPILIQMLGTQDDLISPVDQVDLAVDGSKWAFQQTGYTAAAAGPTQQDYFLIELPDTDHAQAITLTGDPAALRRGHLVQTALTATRPTLAKAALDPALLVDEIDAVDFDVGNTVFVIHGIRDDGFWTHRIAEKVRKHGGLTDTGVTIFRSWTPSYGYFAMLPFVLPWIRREKVEWFADQYVTAFAQYPVSDFHYVGHSNGTYLAARALTDYPAIHFRHVLFAGSVVRRDYPWAQMLNNGRITACQNIVAADDWVVALLPKSVEWIRAFDLGGAGFDGFRDAGLRPALTEYRYLLGGHGAGIGEAHWPEIAAFIVSGKPFPPNPTRTVPGLHDTAPDPTLAILGRLRIGLPALVLAGGLACYLAWSHGGLFGLLLAILVLRFIVLRV
ncbi:alpha/beta hydrolase [Methylobacterium sp. J-026]|uniref:alpha/beta hydrolase n=1 Tax=Methylobacterium sp. J-026 TaxID=2836624 RepID=UPI001FBB9263|nr:alpha/beta hydrolase [Methylobacterium sp. J-026]MCJ2135520.1 alpha/beta hydrolase [Methylobacterium sp. J-026]